MSAIAVEANNDSPIVQPVFTGTARWLAAIVLITGPLLQVIEFLLETGSDDNAALVSFWTAHPSQVGLSMASGLLAVPFLLGGSATLVALTRARSRRLSWLGGAFMAFGLVGLGAVHGYEVAAYGLAQVGNQATATAVLNADHLGLPGGVLLAIFLGGAVLGTLASLPVPAGFNTGMLFVDQACSSLKSVEGQASACFAPKPAPEPGTLGLLSLGLLGIGVGRPRGRVR